MYLYIYIFIYLYLFIYLSIYLFLNIHTPNLFIMFVDIYYICTIFMHIRYTIFGIYSYRLI